MKHNSKKVLQIGMYNNLGGIETYLFNYYQNIDRSKVQFDFINMYEKICFQEELEYLGAKIYNVTNVKKNPLKCKNEIIKVIKDNNYSIVHVNMLSAANIIPLIAAKQAGARVIIAHSHNANTPKSIIKKLLHFINRRLILKIATHYFACSEKAGKWLFGDKIQGNLRIVKNAVDIEKFTFNEEIRKKYREYEKINDKFVIGHIGRFSEQKNHEFLIDVFKKVHEKNENTMLILIGGGELEVKIVEKVNKLGLEKYVKFMGVRNDVNNLYNMMDVFVLPSLFEGLPIVGIEAQVSGLKCLFSDNITRELKITDNAKFISLEKSDYEWAQQILNISSDYVRNDVNNEINKKGYNIKKEARNLENFYLEV